MRFIFNLLLIGIFLGFSTLIKSQYVMNLENDDMYELTYNDADDSTDYHCIWYDNCRNISLGRHSPCYNTTEAIKIYDDDDYTMSLLKSWCPMYINNTADGTYTCCKANQLEDLETQFNMMQQMLSRCPSCYNNLLKLFCALSCDPLQSRFVMPGKTQPVIPININPLPIPVPINNSP
ncbi:hypothetical protein CHUAL_006181 [Chamberlinius hualienensis]